MDWYNDNLQRFMKLYLKAEKQIKEEKKIRKFWSKAYYESQE
jgi:hypothetical protein